MVGLRAELQSMLDAAKAERRRELRELKGEGAKPLASRRQRPRLAAVRGRD
jgi:hypothetical protein